MIRVTLCENAAGALYIVNKMRVDGQTKCARVKQVNDNVHSNRAEEECLLFY